MDSLILASLRWAGVTYRFAVVLLLGTVVPLVARATPEPLYQNFSVSQYFNPAQAGQNNIPQIDATSFDNEGTFEVTYNLLSYQVLLYCPSDTLNFTNGDNAVMAANAPIQTSLLTQNFLSLDAYGAGFLFAEKTNSGYKWASTFYNSGSIRCDSVQDGNNAYDFAGLFGLFGYDSILSSIGACEILATNIYNQGNIDVGVDGIVEITGQTVDLSRGVYNVEGPLPTSLVQNPFFNSFFYNNVTFNSTGGVGTDTNLDWNPADDLTANFAESSFPDDLVLVNPTVYMVEDPISPSNHIFRCVFIQNDSSNEAPASVYFGKATEIDPLSFEPGAAHVGWSAVYTNSATGYLATNYLYLTDDYAFGASTNVQVIPGPAPTGFPDNFTFKSSATPLLTGPSPTGFFDIFANVGSVTNPYAYMNGQLSPTTITTNVSQANPPGSITNVAGQIVITATKELNLQNIVMSGQNYLSIQATNQFDGSAGATIAAPYSDINVGVTNGALVLTNLLESQIPTIGGTIEAWSTRFLTVDATGLTNDFRVLLVHSKLTSVTKPWVRNLSMHTGTNLVISDDLNVYGTLFLDAQNLTITTNGIGFGATSSEGELVGIFPGNMGGSQWPNLRYVTNNGTIGSQNLVLFTNKLTDGAVINNGVIEDNGTIVIATNFLNSGTISNGIGSMSVIANTAVLTNGIILAGSWITNATSLVGGGLTFAANSFTASNSFINCLSLSITPTNLVTDFDVPGNIWVVGATNSTGGNGFSLLNNPGNGDLLGTTITNICPPVNKLEKNTWSGRDFGPSNNGFTNNEALGHLILNAAGPSSLITFTGTGSSNALYVDALELQGSLTNGLYNNYNFTNWLALNTNITIYFAQAYISGISVAEAIDQASVYSGKNGGYVSNNIVVRPGRLRWVPTYAGYFSSTNYVFNGVTNVYNAALAGSQDIDSSGSGLANGKNPSPFFNAQQINFHLSTTNHPVREAILSWTTTPLATNSVYYTTSLLTNNWHLYTNFVSKSSLGAPYLTTVSDTNILTGTRFYKVLVQPWLTYPY